MMEQSAHQYFFDFAMQFVSFTDVEKEILKKAMTYRKLPDKFILAEVGDISEELYFVLSGCVRKYYDKEGERITLMLAIENNFILEYVSFMSGQPGQNTLETLEETELLVIKKKDLERLYKEIPLLNEFFRKILEFALLETQLILNSFIMDSPEERYMKLLNQKPALLHKIPQHILASWLGITATSLSRIRKRIMKVDRDV